MAPLSRSRAALPLGLLLASAALLAVTPPAIAATAPTPPPATLATSPPPPPPVTAAPPPPADSSDSASAPPPPPPDTGVNAYRDGMCWAFYALRPNYTTMVDLINDMDLSWMDPAMPLTFLVFQDGNAMTKLFNAHTLGTLEGGPLRIHILPGVVLKFSDFLAMTERGKIGRVATWLPNRTLTVSRDDDDQGKILLDNVRLTHPDVYASSDHELVAHGIEVPLPANDITTPTTNSAHTTGGAPPSLLLLLLVAPYLSI